MESPEHERVAIEQFMASQAPDETLTHLEKVASEWVAAQDHDIWDVHTERERWWVITGPTNLYAQAQFPSMDFALTFHIGLFIRLEDLRQFRPVKGEHWSHFTEAWRRWEHAGDRMHTAKEAEDYQAVGMLCRESMIAFMRSASKAVSLPVGVGPPQMANVKGWADVLANVVAPGDSSKEHRSYLKAVAKETWDMVNAFTHQANATGFSAYVALQAVEHSFSSWSLALAAHGIGGPRRCPICQSYQLHKEYEPSEGLGVVEVLVCARCDWRSGGEYAEPEEPDLPQAPPEGECVTPEVPLRPPLKRP
jgi:hypothetical protein